MEDMFFERSMVKTRLLIIVAKSHTMEEKREKRKGKKKDKRYKWRQMI